MESYTRALCGTSNIWSPPPGTISIVNPLSTRDPAPRVEPVNPFSDPIVVPPPSELIGIEVVRVLKRRGLKWASLPPPPPPPPPPNPPDRDGVWVWVEKWSTFQALTMVGSEALRSERTRRQIKIGVMVFVMAGKSMRIRELPIMLAT